MRVQKAYRKRKVYIIGGSGGIGGAVAVRFSRMGDDILLFGRNMERLRLVEERVRTASPGGNTCDSAVFDVTRPEECAGVLKSAIRSFGPPDVLVVSSGMAYPDYFESIPYELFRKTIDTNLEGPWNVLSVCVPFMSSGGQIVIVSSLAGLMGTFGYTAYSASKFALVGLAEALRGELNPKGISVSVLCPPDTDTAQLEEENRTKPPETKALSGNIKLLTPDFVAASLIRGISRKKFIIIPGISGTIVHMIHSLFPGLFRMITDRKVKSTQTKDTQDE